MISCKLNDLCSLVKGKQIDTTLYINGGIKESGYYNGYNTEGDTIIISEGGASCGFVNYISERFWLGCHCYKLENPSINKKYLYYLLKANQNRIMELRTGAAMPNIKKASLCNLQLRLTLDEKQQKLVTRLLDAVEKSISISSQILVSLDELIKSRFIEMFGDPGQNPYGWTLKPLLEMGYCKNGLNFHPGESGVEIHCLGVRDFKDLSIINGTEMLPTISLNENPQKESLLKDGDIVFVRSNGNKALVGRCLAVFPHSTPTTYSGFCIRYRQTSSEIIPLFLLNVLKADSMREMVKGRGANIQNLNQRILASLQIPIPPLDLQKAYVEFVEQVDKSKYGMLKRIKSAMIELVHSQKLVFVTF